VGERRQAGRGPRWRSERDAALSQAAASRRSKLPSPSPNARCTPTCCCGASAGAGTGTGTAGGPPAAPCGCSFERRKAISLAQRPSLSAPRSASSCCSVSGLASQSLGPACCRMWHSVSMAAARHSGFFRMRSIDSSAPGGGLRGGCGRGVGQAGRLCGWLGIASAAAGNHPALLLPPVPWGFAHAPSKLATSPVTVSVANASACRAKVSRGVSCCRFLVTCGRAAMGGGWAQQGAGLGRGGCGWPPGHSAGAGWKTWPPPASCSAPSPGGIHPRGPVSCGRQVERPQPCRARAAPPAPARRAPARRGVGVSGGTHAGRTAAQRAPPRPLPPTPAAAPRALPPPRPTHRAAPRREQRGVEGDRHERLCELLRQLRLLGKALHAAGVGARRSVQLRAQLSRDLGGRRQGWWVGGWVGVQGHQGGPGRPGPRGGRGARRGRGRGRGRGRPRARARLAGCARAPRRPPPPRRAPEAPLPSPPARRWRRPVRRASGLHGCGPAEAARRPARRRVPRPAARRRRGRH
jgi:hypothetical protein